MAVTEKKKVTKDEKTKKVEELVKTPKNVETKENTQGKNKKTISRKEAEKKNQKAVKKAQKENFFAGVVSEFKKVTWPTKKDMGKLSRAVLALLVFFAGFFLIIDVIMAALKAVL